MDSHEDVKKIDPEALLAVAERVGARVGEALVQAVDQKLKTHPPIPGLERIGPTQERIVALLESLIGKKPFPVDIWNDLKNQAENDPGASAEIRRLKAETGELQSRLALTREQAAELEDRLRTAETREQSAAQRAQELTALAQTVGREQRESAQELESLRSALEVSRSLAQDRQAAVDSAQATITFLESEIEGLSRRLEEAAASSGLAASDQARQEEARLRSLVQAGRLAALEQELHQVRAREDAGRLALEQASARIEGFEQQVRDAEARLEAMRQEKRAEADQAASALAEAQARIAALMEEIQHLEHAARDAAMRDQTAFHEVPAPKQEAPRPQEPEQADQSAPPSAWPSHGPEQPKNGAKARNPRLPWILCAILAGLLAVQGIALRSRTCPPLTSQEPAPPLARAGVVEAPPPAPSAQTQAPEQPKTPVQPLELQKEQKPAPVPPPAQAKAPVEVHPPVQTGEAARPPKPVAAREPAQQNPEQVQTAALPAPRSTTAPPHSKAPEQGNETSVLILPRALAPLLSALNATSPSNRKALAGLLPFILENSGSGDAGTRGGNAVHGKQSKKVISFSLGTPELSPEAVRQVADAVQKLKKKPGAMVWVTGYTDATPLPSEVGTQFDNLALSRARAVSVARLLVEASIDPESIAVFGLGSALPLAPNDNPGNRARNRRVEITWIWSGQ